jgi:hypothetical protein
LLCCIAAAKRTATGHGAFVARMTAQHSVVIS